ncbi:carboxypeptidase regulatory-like domain-containing protein [candidate division WOR-3 bacterium]|nr:carboxypeptidase regulatory-like domain-containing protein [candidate division WOR-3 bacterium]
MLTSIALLATLVTAGPVQLIEITVPGRAALRAVSRELAVKNVGPGWARVLADADERAWLSGRGHAPRVIIADYAAHLDSVFQDYHTYDEVCAALAALAAARPDICRLDTVGFSVQGRAIPALLVTDNPLTSEPEPGLRVTGAHHGDEKVSTEICLAFAQFLIASYDTSAAVRSLVNNRELWLLPIVNPDGHVAGRRSNANSVDVNRDYGYEWFAEGNSPRPYSQPESRAIWQHSLENSIAFGYDFHSAASYVNYLWDNDSCNPPDSFLIRTAARQYADSTYGSNTTQLAPIEGWSWYDIYGSCQDACFGLSGILDYTIETRQPSERARVDSICLANRRALLGIAGLAGTGARGTVTDSVTGEPLRARIAVTNPDRWHVYADPALGDYHKPLSPGTYDLTASAPGYVPRTLRVTVPQSDSVVADFALAADTGTVRSCEELAWLVHGDVNFVIPTWSSLLLGPPDGRFHSLGRRGIACLATGPEACPDLLGADIFVHDGDTVPDGYWVAASQDWNGPWTSLGHAEGTAGFDLGAAGLDSCRYIRVASDSTGSSADPRAGVDVDAVTWRVPGAGIAGPEAAPSRERLWPNPVGGAFEFRGAPGTVLRLFDMSGRLVQAIQVRNGAASVDTRQLGLAPGIYLVQAGLPGRETRHKLVVCRSFD